MIDRCERIALDSNCFIYLLEDSPYAASLYGVLRRLEHGTLLGISSVLTLTELLTGPYKLNNLRAAREYRTLLEQFPGMTFHPVHAAVADKAAELRAQYGFKTPDAIQAATAILFGADALVTNEAQLKRLDFPVILLSELNN